MPMNGITCHDGLREQRGVTMVGLAVNLILVAFKVGVGLAARSSAIVADGLHSGSDLASDLLVLWSIRVVRRPADSDHHYGHARFDSICAAGIGILLVGAALWVGADSVVGLSAKHEAMTSWWPFWAAIASILLKEALFWWTRAVGRKYRNNSITANAWHHRSDAFSSVAVALGVAAVLIGGPKWAFLDHLTAIVLAAFLVVIGARIAVRAVHDLSDRAPERSVVRRIEGVIGQIPGVVSFHAFRARRSGGNIEMDVHVQVAPDITVAAGHDIATRVEREVCAVLPEVSGVVVHIEPAETIDAA